MYLTIMKVLLEIFETTVFIAHMKITKILNEVKVIFTGIAIVSGAALGVVTGGLGALTIGAAVGGLGGGAAVGAASRKMAAKSEIMKRDNDRKNFTDIA